MSDALRAARAANARGIHAVVNHLGEHHREKSAVEASLREYLALLGAVRAEGIRGCVSVKPTQLGILVDREYALSRFLVLLDAVRASGQRLWLDMEAASTTDDTLWVYENLLERYDNVGVCLQANLRRTDRDLERLVALGGKIRLTKGAYPEGPDIAYRRRDDVDRRYLRFLEALFRSRADFAVATHDGRMVERTLALAESSDAKFEFQMLMGVRDALMTELVRKGFRVLEYIPYGPTWLPYFLRRLRERPRNVVTLMRSLVGG